MRISDWSSDVCSSDLLPGHRPRRDGHRQLPAPHPGLLRPRPPPGRRSDDQGVPRLVRRVRPPDGDRPCRRRVPGVSGSLGRRLVRTRVALPVHQPVGGGASALVLVSGRPAAPPRRGDRSRVGRLMAFAQAAGESREFPGVWGGGWFGSVWLFLCTSRWAGWLLLWRWQRDGRLVRNVAVLGAGPAAIALARRLQASNEARVVGVFTESGAQIDLDGSSAEGDLLLALIRSRQVDEVILAWPFGSSPEGIRQQLSKLAATLVEVKIDPGLSTLGAPVGRFSPIAGLPILTVLGPSPAGWGALFKRAEDPVLTGLDRKSTRLNSSH